MMMQKEIDKSKLINKWYIIETDNVVYQTWKMFMIILSFLTSFIYMYFASFLDKLQPNEE